MKGTVRYDLLVIGAGPAGTTAARAAAQDGMKVLVIDKKAAIGEPVQCAGYVPKFIRKEVDFDKGCIIQEVDRTALEFYEATSAAVRDLGIIPTVDLHDRLSATIRGEFADGKDIWIDIVALTEQSARIKIRVGWFGDKMRSEMILNSIQTSL